MKKDLIYNTWQLLKFAFYIAVLYGYLLNLKAVWHSDYSMLTLTGEAVVRIIGVFMPIIGGFIGYL